MISPSKVKHQQHKQPSRDNSDIHSHVRLQRGSKPLEKKSFYLDIKNHRLLASLEEKIKGLGGTIELFLVKSVTLVISDRADKFRQNNCDKTKWGCDSGESGGIPSLRSIEIRTPISTPSTPYGGEYPLSNSTNIRSQTTQKTKSRADAMLERALTQPQQCSVDPLNNAQNWGIPIWATKRLQGWLEKIYESLKDNNNLKRNTDRSNTEKSLRVKHLKNSYIKFESFKRDSRPVFLELPVWPKLNFDGDSGSCPFETRIREKKVCKEQSDASNKQKGKEMTRRPRATATRGRRTEQLVAGSCEICRVDYCDLSKHLQSDKHLAFVRNDDNFLSLDKLITSGASVEAFLRANEVGQDCSIYSADGDEKLHGVDIDNIKVKNTGKTDLSNFNVDGIKMVQCNGPRRNLNLKLSPPHNLRTRSKKESGHLLRSKGSPWHEVQEKSDKFYDKFEGFTIKKRAKGTIWIEEDENPVKKCSRIDDSIEEIGRIDDDNLDKGSFTVENNYTRKSKVSRDQCEKKNVESLDERILPKLERNDLTIGSDIENDNSRIVNIPRLEKETRINDDIDKFNGDTKNHDDARRISADNIDECKNGFNGFERVNAPESFPASQLPGNSNNENTSTTTTAATITTINRKSPLQEKTKIDDESREFEIVCNGVVNNDEKIMESMTKEEKTSRGGRIGKRSGRSFRGRPRLSVEERLIEDNRAYYKVEVLGNKLRSSTGPWSTAGTASNDTTMKNPETNVIVNDGITNDIIEDPARINDGQSSEKPVVVRFKRVRRSELSLLSDEAESFMFGEPKRDDDTSEVSEADQSSVMPRDTESDSDLSNVNTTGNFTLPSSTVNSSLSLKQETIEDDSQDSTYAGRARKRRRTQAEALIKDNEDYYKFEIPGSRLRFQTPLAGAKEQDDVIVDDRNRKEENHDNGGKNIGEEPVEKLYPSKPSPEVEKMQFSFEAIPRSEPWYQTYQRQDEGAEFWHYFSEADERKPFLLPYEIENFHERLAKLCQKSDTRRKSRGRGRNGIGRSPRKSPRCHASTLAIMSTIIRKREQQQQPIANLSVVMEENSPRCSGGGQNDTPKLEVKQQQQYYNHNQNHRQQQQEVQQQTQDHSKSDSDAELREIAKSIDVMLNAEAALDPDDSFETLLMEQSRETHIEVPTLQPGPPSNLLDLLDNCHEYFNCLENSSCASSECGEMGNTESPLKRRKKRKNRTGWPGIKMRKKMQAKQLIDAYVTRERLSVKKINDEKTIFTRNCQGTSDILRRLECGDATARLTEKRMDEVKKNISRITKDEQENSESIGKEDTARNFVDSVKRDRQELRVENVARDVTILPPLQCETISGSEDSSLLNNEESTGRKNSSSKNNEINSLGNDENDCRADSNNSVSTRQLCTKISTRKRQRVHDTSSAIIDSCQEIENNDNLYMNNVNTTIISRKNYTTNGMSKRRTARDGCSAITPENHDNEHIIDHHDVTTCQKESLLTRKPVRTRKRQRHGTMRNEVDYEDENCKNDTYTSSLKSNGKTDNHRGVKRKNNEAVTSETMESDIECSLGVERVSPSLLPTNELQNRRSSMEFQPVVRMMKIEDQVDMDSILSVTVASNRRLRSSSSPRSNVQPIAKRYKRSKGPFGRWIKNS